MTDIDVDAIAKLLANDPKFLSDIIYRMADGNVRLSAEGTELRGIIQVVLTAHELKGSEFDGLKAWINEELRADSGQATK